MFEIEKITIEKNLKYKDTIIFKYVITYPHIISNQSIYGIDEFNRFNQIYALNRKLYVEKNLFEMAKKDFDYNVSNGFPTQVYELILNFTVTYQKKFIISLYQEEYLYTGGAHGSTTVTAQNWNLLYGNQFLLYDLYKNDSSYLLYILREINHQIQVQLENNETAYFDNSCQLVLNTFQFNQFYLTEKNLVIFFQSYDIAPYSSGIPRFFIPR